MGTQYTKAPQVEKIAEELIPQFHPHLKDVRIEYVFIDKVPLKGGSEIWGSMRKISSLPAYFAASEDDKLDGYAEPFFAMIISSPIWENLPEAKRRALVDHELCHAKVEEDKDGNPKLKIAPHDLEEFTEIVKRHGLWRDSIKDFMSVGIDK